jgi:hypothetical protein
MALVKVKRKRSSGNNNVVLQAGEPYYNLADKTLFVGSTDGESVSGKKHIAQITQISEDLSSTVTFRIGEDSRNTFSQTINNVGTAHRVNGSVSLGESYYGTQDPNDSTKIVLTGADNGTIYVRLPSEE